MTKVMAISWACCAALLATARPAWAATASQPDPGAVTVAVLDYEGGLAGNPDLGRQVSEVLAARLSMDDSLVMVERARLGQVLEELHLPLTGLGDPEKSAQVGKLLGARLLVMGKVFLIDKQLIIATKVVGVETGQLKGTLREVDMTKPLSEALALVTQDIDELIKRDAARLLPAGVVVVDPLAKLGERLAGKARPTVAVVIREAHQERVVLDPAVETEIKKCLIACGLTVVDTAGANLADWARMMLKGEKPPWPGGLDQADYVVVGQAVSESVAPRLAGLVGCVGRVEINLIDRKTGRIALADDTTQRAVDLAEGIAAKTALQKAGRTLGVKVLTTLADTLPVAKGGQPASKPEPAK